MCFGSFQDFLGLENGVIKEKNLWVHEINWDLVIFDEYHFGAWRDSAKHLFAMDDDKSEAVKKAMKSGKKLTPKEKRELSEEEKKYKSKRKEIQEKFIKFTTRIPVFMYLTDFREMSLVDVITDLEPVLFKRVTGLSVKDFELLVSLNVFNEGLMNDAVCKFKRYEYASLTYAGLDRHTGENVGLYNTVLSREDYNAMAGKPERMESSSRRERAASPVVFLR